MTHPMKTILLSIFFALVSSAAFAEDPLLSWNDGAAKQSIIDFVEKVTMEGEWEFIPVPARIAVFDNDNGTLWPENPIAAGR